MGPQRATLARSGTDRTDRSSCRTLTHWSYRRTHAPVQCTELCRSQPNLCQQQLGPSPQRHGSALIARRPQDGLTGRTKGLGCLSAVSIVSSANTVGVGSGQHSRHGRVTDGEGSRASQGTPQYPPQSVCGMRRVRYVTSTTSVSPAWRHSQQLSSRRVCVASHGVHCATAAVGDAIQLR